MLSVRLRYLQVAVVFDGPLLVHRAVIDIAFGYLDETDYSNREYEATLDNIKDAAWRLKNEFDLPDGWECDVYSWFSDQESSEIENRDDQGGYPKEAAWRAVFKALGFKEQE